VGVGLSRGKKVRKAIRKTVNNLLRTCNGLRLINHDGRNKIRFSFIVNECPKLIRFYIIVHSFDVTAISSLDVYFEFTSHGLK
jgi:hypothetical protein